MQRDNGFLKERKEYILDMLFQWLFQAYRGLPIPNSLENKIYILMENVLNSNTSYIDDAEKMKILKNQIFTKDINTYNEAIGIIKFYVDYLEDRKLNYCLLNE